MVTVLEAAKEILNVFSVADLSRLTDAEKEAIIALKQAVCEHNYQVTRYQQRKFIVFKKCLHIKAVTPEGKRVKIIVEPGDKGRFIGHDNKGNNVMIESTDPGRLQYKLSVTDERRTWEWTNE